jgi:hypothetical protein
MTWFCTYVQVHRNIVIVSSIFAFFCTPHRAQSCLLFVIIIDKKPISIIDNSTGEKEEIGCDLVGLHHDYLSLSSVSSLTS